VKNGKLVLPDGMSYRVLVLPETKVMPLPVLQKIKELVSAGATVVGPKPEKDSGLKDYPQSDVRIRELAAAIWGKCDGHNIKQQVYGKGKIYWNVLLKDVLKEKGVGPDFICDNDNAFIDFIHRSVGDAEVYFITNRSNREEKVTCRFRSIGSQPQIWDAVTGEMNPVKAYSHAAGYTGIPLQFAPFQSWFIVFPKTAMQKPVAARNAATNFPSFTPVQELTGPWTVHFDVKWGGPASVEFNTLEDWTQRLEEGIKYYSGAATYVKRFDANDIRPGKQYFLETGVVKNIAELTLNGKKLGILWTAPWRVEVTGLLKPTGNVLEIVVVNCWPNRLIGDAALPPEKRLTRTNITFRKDAPLMSSGLLGPVLLLSS
jgi:hypothetical protein